MCLFHILGEQATPTQQLSLALSLNRADVAETEIFTDEVVWKVSNQNDAFIVNHNVINNFSAITITDLRSRIFRVYLHDIVVRYIRFK